MRWRRFVSVKSGSEQEDSQQAFSHEVSGQVIEAQEEQVQKKQDTGQLDIGTYSQPQAVQHGYGQEQLPCHDEVHQKRDWQGNNRLRPDDQKDELRQQQDEARIYEHHGCAGEGKRQVPGEGKPALKESYLVINQNGMCRQYKRQEYHQQFLPEIGRCIQHKRCVQQCQRYHLDDEEKKASLVKNIREQAAMKRYFPADAEAGEFLWYNKRSIFRGCMKGMNMAGGSQQGQKDEQQHTDAGRQDITGPDGNGCHKEKVKQRWQAKLQVDGQQEKKELPPVDSLQVAQEPVSRVFRCLADETHTFQVVQQPEDHDHGKGCRIL